MIPGEERFHINGVAAVDLHAHAGECRRSRRGGVGSVYARAAAGSSQGVERNFSVRECATGRRDGNVERDPRVAQGLGCCSGTNIVGALRSR